MFTCATVKEYLSRYYDQECPKDMHAQIEKYLKTSEKCMECRHCVKELDDYEYVRRALAHLPAYAPSKKYHRDFAAKLAACKKEPQPAVHPAFKKKSAVAYTAITAVAMIILFLGVSLFTSSNVDSGISAPVITYLQGKAYIADNSSDTPRIAMVKHTITKGDTIATGPYSKIDIVMKDKFKITLKQNSVMTVEELSEESDHLKIICRLARGGVLADVNKYENPSDFQILTELVNVAVKGTQFSVDAEGTDDNQKVTVAVIEGAVAVKHAQQNNNEEYMVRENHKMVFANDANVMTQQLSDADIESFWEVYEIGNRSTDINYQATSSDNKDIYRSQTQ